MKADGDQFNVRLVKAGDDVVYAQRKDKEGNVEAVCYLCSSDGSRQVGIEVVGGLPKFTMEPIAIIREEWSKKKTLLVAKQIAIAAGLSGDVTEIEGSISTTHRVRIGS